ncbi:MAG TPA: DNA polymerase III subunit chi [Burkholderiales bacterium]|nr:DNA polymerase III subunit chi [Burkholderiales bacterium]
MTEIDFYTHVENKLQVACSLSAKALEKGLRVMIYAADAETTEKLDRLMWCYPAISFIPHCRAADPLAQETPIIIDHYSEPLPHDQVLLNLHPEWPPFFSRFQRLIEIVGLNEADSQAGRNRYRFYRDRGYDIRHHDLSKTAAEL